MKINKKVEDVVLKSQRQINEERQKHREERIARVRAKIKSVRQDPYKNKDLQGGAE